MTKEQALRKSVDMWEWLSLFGKESKTEYFEDNNISDIPIDYCYLCEYAKQQEGRIVCKYCPVENWCVSSNIIVKRCYNKYSVCEQKKDSIPFFVRAKNILFVLNRELNKELGK